MQPYNVRVHGYSGNRTQTFHFLDPTGGQRRGRCARPHTASASGLQIPQGARAAGTWSRHPGRASSQPRSAQGGSGRGPERGLRPLRAKQPQSGVALPGPRAAARKDALDTSSCRLRGTEERKVSSLVWFGSEGCVRSNSRRIPEARVGARG